VNLAHSMPFAVNFWQVENLYAQNMDGVYSRNRARAEQGDETARAWVEHFTHLAEKLHLRVQ